MNDTVDGIIGIEREVAELRAENARLCAALEPFARVAIEEWPFDGRFIDCAFRAGDLRRARAALKGRVT